MKTQRRIMQMALPLVLALATPLAAQTELSDFAWLTGTWKGEFDGQIGETTWRDAKAGLMAGIARVSEGNKVTVLEFFTLRQTPQGLEFCLRHFDAALGLREKGDPFTFQLVSWDGK